MRVRREIEHKNITGQGQHVVGYVQATEPTGTIPEGIGWFDTAHLNFYLSLGINSGINNNFVDRWFLVNGASAGVIRADVDDSNPSTLDQKCDNITLEVDLVAHKIQIKDNGVSIAHLDIYNDVDPDHTQMLSWTYNGDSSPLPQLEWVTANAEEIAGIPVDVSSKADTYVLTYSESTDTFILAAGATAAGDMLKATYDTNNDGTVDSADHATTADSATNADNVPWSGVSETPNDYPPSAHASSHATGQSDALSYSDVGAAASDHDHDNTYSALTHASQHFASAADVITPSDIGAEPALGTPAASGYILSSSDADVRSWIANTTGDMEKATYDSNDDGSVDNADNATTADSALGLDDGLGNTASAADTAAAISASHTAATAGDGIDVTDQEISVKFDNDTITLNEAGELIAGSLAGGPYEPELGNPETTGFVLSSTDQGERSWIEMTGGTVDESDPLSLHLDQTTPQTIENGRPIFSGGIDGGFDTTGDPNIAITQRIYSPPLASTLSFTGQRANALAYGAEKYGATIVVTPAQTSGVSEKVFHPGPIDYLYWDGTGSADTELITIEAMFDTPILPNYDSRWWLAITNRTLSSGPLPLSINVYSYNIDTMVWDKVVDNKAWGDVPYYGCWTSNMFNSIDGGDGDFKIYGLKIEFIMPNSWAADGNGNRRFAIQQILLFHPTEIDSPQSLPIIGGTVYGDLQPTGDYKSNDGSVGLTKTVDSMVVENGLTIDLPDTFAPTLRNGIVDKSKWAISYDPDERIFTIVVTTAGVYYAGGIKVTLAADTYTTTLHANTTGIYYLYGTSAGDLLVSSSFPNITGNAAIIAYVYFNTDVPQAVLFDERHPNTWNSALHLHEHLYEGARLYSGGTIDGYSLHTNGDAATSFSIEECIFDDESLRHTLDLVADGGPYSIWERTGADASNLWTWDTTSLLPYLHDGDDPYYNQNNNGTWQKTAITANNKWVNYWLCAVNAYNDAGDNYKHRFVHIMGQSLHTTIASAQSESFLTSISWGVMPFNEIVPLYKITYRRVSDSNEKNVQIEQVSRIIGTNVTSITAVAPTTHNALSGRATEGAHPASAISIDTSAFTGNLSETDVDLQIALNTIDAIQVGAGGGTGTSTSILKGDGSGGFSDASAGTDYQAPLVAGTDYQTPLVSGTDYQTPLVSSTDYAPATGTSTALLKGNGTGGFSDASAGTDYQAPLTAGTDYQTPLVAGTDYQVPLVAGTDYQTPLVSSTDYAPATGTSTALLKGSGTGGFSDASAGTDYQAPLVAGTDYQTPLVAGTDYQTPLVADTDYLTPGTASSTYQPAGSYLTTETDPAVGAVTGIVMANGFGTISAAVSGTDYAPSTGTSTAILKGNGAGAFSDATAGTDYQAPLTAGTDYQTPLVAGTDYQTPLVADTDYLTPGTASSTYQAAGSYLTEETDPVAMEALSALTTIDTSTGTLSDVITAVNAIILAFGGSAPA